MIPLGGGACWAAIGAGNDPRLAPYVGIKLRLLLVLTALVSALLDALWVRRSGLDLRPGQSLRSVLLAFGPASIVLGSLAPIVLFVAYAVPGPAVFEGRLGHDVLGATYVGFSAWTGVLVVKRQWAWLGSSRGGRTRPAHAPARRAVRAPRRAAPLEAVTGVLLTGAEAKPAHPVTLFLGLLALVGSWGVVFLLTSRQMTTAPRPFDGTSPRPLEPKERFFLQHWGLTIAEDTRSDAPGGSYR